MIKINIYLDENLRKMGREVPCPCYVILGQYFTKLPFNEQQRQLVSLVGIEMLYYNRVTRIICYLLSHHQSLCPLP